MKFAGFIAGALLLSHTTSADHPHKCTRRFNFALNSFPPLYWVDKNGTPQGTDLQFAAAIMKKMNCPFSTQGVTRPLAKDTLARGKTDIVLVVAENTYPDSEGTYVPLFKGTREALVRKSKIEEHQTFADLFKKKNIIFTNLIGSRASLTAAEQSHLFNEGRLIEVPDGISAYGLLKGGRADVAVAPAFLNNHYSDQLNMGKEFTAVMDKGPKMSFGLYLSNKTLSEEEKKKLILAVKELREEKVFIQTLTPYLRPGQAAQVLEP